MTCNNASPCEIQAKYLLLNEDDVRRVQSGSKVNNPVGFLLFLERASRVTSVNKPMNKPELLMLKDSILTGDIIQILDENISKDPDTIRACPLSLSCNSHMSNLPKTFDTNLDHVEHSTRNLLKLGNDSNTHSIKEAANQVWIREFSRNIAGTRFIPQHFMEKIHNIPKDLKEPFRVVKIIVSSCERALKTSKQVKKKTFVDMNRIAKDMEWAQTLLDIWQWDLKKTCSRELIWREEAWLDTLVAPLMTTDSGHLAELVQNHLQSDQNPDIQAFLQRTYPDQSKDEVTTARMTKSKEDFEAFLQSKHRITRQKQILFKFLNSSSLYLGTFFIGQVLGLKSPQSECLVQKNGTIVGDLFEKEVFKALKVSASRFPYWNTIFCGLEVLGIEQRCNEFDFLIFSGQVKMILYVECKYTLTEEVAEKIHKQSNNAFKYLQEHLPLSSGWQFLTWACFEHLQIDPLLICKRCEPFLVKVSSLRSRLNELLVGTEGHMIDEETKVGYTAIVKRFLFYALANKQTFEGDDVAKHQLKMVNFPNEDIILWNLDQLNVLQNDPPKMIVKSLGLFGTGKTEILKTKLIKLATARLEPNILIAFLISRRHRMVYKHEHLLTKAIRFKLRSLNVNNVGVAELHGTEDIRDMILEMFPECNHDPSHIHVFIDEASHNNKAQIEKFLARNPKEANNVIWIVDTDNSIQVPLDKGFVIEEGLRLNLRNSEEVLNAIELARHGQQFDGCPTVDGERDSKVFSEALKFEPSVKKILVVLDSYRLNKLLKITLEDGINGRFLYYGCLEDSETCTDEELEAFFDASNQDRLILVAPEHVSDGIEVEMVLVPEIHDVANTTRYRAKTKLKTAYLNSSAHVELLQQNPTPLFKNEIEDVLRQTTWQIGALGTSGICVYSQLRPLHDLNKKSTVHYYSGMTEFQTKHPSWMNHYGPPKVMKIYRVVQEKSPNSTTSNYPFLLWLQPHDHQVIFLIGVEDSFTSCTSFINVEDVPIVNLFVNNLVPTLGIWRDIFIVEIFRSFFLNIDLETSFDLDRLFTIWSRVSEELKRMHLLNVDERTPFPSSDLRRTLLKRPLQFSMSLQANLSSIVSLLPTFAPNGEIHHWDLIQTLLGWWNPNDGDALANHLLRREFAHHTYMPLDNEARGYDLIGYWDISPDLTTLLTVFSPQRLLQAQIQPDSPFQVEKITSLRMELRTGFLSWMSPAATLSKLNWPLIQLIWLKEMTWLWKRIIKKKFRHGLKKPWSHVISKWHTKSRKVEKKMFKVMGITSIYFGEETQTTAYSVAKELFAKEIVYFEMFNEISLAFIELLVFISQQPKTC